MGVPEPALRVELSGLACPVTCGGSRMCPSPARSHHHLGTSLPSSILLWNVLALYRVGSDTLLMNR